MAQFKLLAGQHLGPDYSQKPVTRKDPVTGEESERYPSKTYNAGDIVESDTDLVARLGAEKFQLVGGEVYPTKNSANVQQQSKFPGGQVSSGFQGGDPNEHQTMVEEGIQQQLESEGNAEGQDPSQRRSVAGGQKEVPPNEIGGRKLSPQEQADYQRARNELNKKSYAELVEIAKAQKVDLKGAARKEDVVKAILSK